MKVKVKAYAKINLMLDIVAQRKDGYHDLSALFFRIICENAVINALIIINK